MNLQASREERIWSLGVALSLMFVFLLLLANYAPPVSSQMVGLMIPENSSKHESRLYTNQDMIWLAKNIYFEARGEPREGQVAVAFVTLHRVQSELFPNTIHEVVMQQKPNCQFSWTCDGKKHTLSETRAWNTALDVASSVLQGREQDPVEGSLFYHRKPEYPYKDSEFYTINDHIFLKSST